MKRFFTAWNFFWRILFNSKFAAAAKTLALPPSSTTNEETATTPTASRSEAITLLAVLQREARLIDFLKESLADYSDAQIGAAVRDIHRDAAATIERLFTIHPLRSEAEGATIIIPTNLNPHEYQLVGTANTAKLPKSGNLSHHGWVATKCEIPAWSGPSEDALIIAPAEIQIS